MVPQMWQSSEFKSGELDKMPREHVNKAVAIFTKSLTAYMAVAANGTVQASAVTLSVCKPASSSHHQQTGSFQSYEQTIGEDNAQNADKWRVVLVEIA